jgi:IS1 family transposase
MWSYVGKKANPRWLWYAIDHHTGKVLAYVFGRRQDKVFLCLQALLEPFGITRYYTDGWGHTSVMWMLRNTLLVRNTCSASRASTSTCGPGSSGWCAARSAFRRRSICTIWSLDYSSTAMSSGEPSNMRSTTLKHLLLFIGVSRCKGYHPGSPSTAGGHKAVSSRFSATRSTKGKPTTIARSPGMSGGHMGGGGSKIASSVMARAAHGAPRANGFRAVCPRSSIPRPGTGRKGNWPGIESAQRHNTQHPYLLRSLMVCGRCGRRMVGTWSAQGGRYICALRYPRYAPGACPGRSLSAALIEASVWEHVKALRSDPAVLRTQYEQGRGDPAVDVRAE